MEAIRIGTADAQEPEATEGQQHRRGHFTSQIAEQEIELLLFQTPAQRFAARSEVSEWVERTRRTAGLQQPGLLNIDRRRIDQTDAYQIGVEVLAQTGNNGQYGVFKAARTEQAQR